ncbi:hypothetical protein [Bacillus alkalicellulosilyticus]|uniref:hypothetical protein n=1 Tax=Alkalihalobacterium alkalicellulosilyticum TaxID=1912214 RepID=UPI0009970FA5|nr:hypothetical protein [Bacillus alkalicellulosilyticus]
MNIVEQVKTFTKHMGDEFLELFKHNPTKKVRIIDFIRFVIKHGDAYEKNYLGITFTTYEMRMGDYQFRVETKGKDNQILEFIVHHQEETYYSYQWFQEKQSLGDKMELPETFLHDIKYQVSKIYH